MSSAIGFLRWPLFYIDMGYRECEYYCDGYCIMGEKTAQRMKYTCIERNDSLEVTATYLKLPYIKPEMARLRRPLYKILA